MPDIASSAAFVATVLVEFVNIDCPTVVSETPVFYQAAPGSNTAEAKKKPGRERPGFQSLLYRVYRSESDSKIQEV